MRAPIRLIGLGSPHGDDRVGWLLAQDLARGGDLPVEAETVADPMGLLARMGDCRILIVLDGCRAGGPAGRVHCGRWPAMGLAAGPHGSTHGLGVAEALRLAEALGRLPPVVWLIGVEVGACAPGTDPGLAVRGAHAQVRGLIEAILRRATAEADNARAISRR